MITSATRLITAAELSEILDVPIPRIWTMARKNQIPFIRLPGGRQQLRFDLPAVIEALGGDGNGKTTT